MMNSRGRRFLFAGMAIVILAGAIVLFSFDPAEGRIYPVCQFRRITGWQCPGCGALRASHQLMHGNVAGALRLNAMVVVSAPVLAFAGGWLLWSRWKRRPMNFRPVWLWLYVGAWLVFGLVRELPGVEFVSERRAPVLREETF